MWPGFKSAFAVHLMGLWRHALVEDELVTVPARHGDILRSCPFL